MAGVLTVGLKLMRFVAVDNATIRELATKEGVWDTFCPRELNKTLGHLHVNTFWNDQKTQYE
jgi:hypothetical protein